MVWVVHRHDGAGVADIAATVYLGVGVNPLLEQPALGNANLVSLLNHRREIADDDRDVAVLVSLRRYVIMLFSQSVQSIHSKPEGSQSLLIQRRGFSVHLIEITDQLLDAEMVGVLKKVPIEARIVIPFPLLGELTRP